MKTKNKLVLFILILALIAVVFIVIVWPSIYDHQCKNRVYNDMESSLSSVESSNIRIISVSGNEDEGIGYSAGASGVIFDHNDGRYYALTAYHVINAEDADHFIVATALTPSFDEYKKGTVDAKAFTGSKIRNVTIGANVSTIKKYAFKGSKATTVTLKTKLLKKSKVKGSLSGSKVKTVKVSVGSKTENKKYVKTYKTYFTKANAGVKVTVK